MLDIDQWMQAFVSALDVEFHERVLCIGLQGSWGRGEAREGSDIDVVVVLDTLSAADIRRYDAVLQTLPQQLPICGFLSGKAELCAWEPSDLFQLYHDTTPVRGSLDMLLPMIDAAAVQRAVRIGACSLYHACVHNMLYEKDKELLRGLYKSAAFVLQAWYYWQSGTYLRQQKVLCGLLQSPHREIMETNLRCRTGVPLSDAEFSALSEQLFAWVQQVLQDETICTDKECQNHVKN